MQFINTPTYSRVLFQVSSQTSFYLPSLHYQRSRSSFSPSLRRDIVTQDVHLIHSQDLNLDRSRGSWRHAVSNGKKDSECQLQLERGAAHLPVCQSAKV